MAASSPLSFVKRGHPSGGLLLISRNQIRVAKHFDCFPSAFLGVLWDKRF